MSQLRRAGVESVMEIGLCEKRYSGWGFPAQIYGAAWKLDLIIFPKKIVVGLEQKSPDRAEEKFVFVYCILCKRRSRRLYKTQRLAISN